MTQAITILLFRSAEKRRVQDAKRRSTLLNSSGVVVTIIRGIGSYPKSGKVHAA